MPSLDEQLNAYLSDAHAIEEQALPQMRAAPDMAGDPELADAFRAHLAETERHEQLTRERLEARGDSPSAVMLPFGERVRSGEICLRSSPFLTLRYTNCEPQ